MHQLLWGECCYWSTWKQYRTTAWEYGLSQGWIQPLLGKILSHIKDHRIHKWTQGHSTLSTVCMLQDASFLFRIMSQVSKWPVVNYLPHFRFLVQGSLPDTLLWILDIFISRATPSIEVSNVRKPRKHTRGSAKYIGDSSNSSGLRIKDAIFLTASEC